ncbi:MULTISPECIES: TetR/AcrR family transcriptional regulator [unclassified Kutzneria]|uniref:TetR/AcrR family transcriptional regulator n=1 Tax=unclassified Kutzneria TaxID=2621979 RepID=UPI000694ABF3|nr:TetR/AcrR family transcriptional regulator [Kutzneria sp. 744]
MNEAPRDRLLTTAARLFYAEGIRAVGMDRLVAEANVTRSTCYRHFAGKDDLVLAYLDSVDRLIRDAVETIVAERPPVEALVGIFEFYADFAASEDFRGCNFLNAAAEHADRNSPPRRLIAAHRAWLRETFRSLLGQTGHPQPDQAAGALVLLRDGAMSAAELDDPATVRETLLHTVGGVISG